MNSASLFSLSFSSPKRPPLLLTKADWLFVLEFVCHIRFNEEETVLICSYVWAKISTQNIPSKDSYLSHLSSLTVVVPICAQTPPRVCQVIYIQLCSTVKIILILSDRRVRRVSVCLKHKLKFHKNLPQMHVDI